MIILPAHNVHQESYTMVHGKLYSRNRIAIHVQPREAETSAEGPLIVNGHHNFISDVVVRESLLTE